LKKSFFKPTNLKIIVFCKKHIKMVTELTNGKFNEFIKEGTVLIDFYADWCMPCVMMGPIVEEAAEKFKKKIKFGKVNVEDGQEIAQKFNVSSIPNFVVFKDGKVAGQFMGGMDEENFESKLKKFL
jgi:thioredoxin 1